MDEEEKRLEQRRLEREARKRQLQEELAKLGGSVSTESEKEKNVIDKGERTVEEQSNLSEKSKSVTDNKKLLEDLEEELEDLKDENEEKDIDIKRISVKLENKQDELDEVNDKYSVAKKKEDEITTKLEDALNQLKEAETKLKFLEKQIQEKEARRSKIEERSIVRRRFSTVPHNLNSAIDKELVGAKHVDSFEGSYKKVGVQVWRIVEDQISVIPQLSHGIFRKNDAYIILNNQIKLERREEQLLHQIFSWIGEDTSLQDKLYTRVDELKKYLAKDDITISHQTINNESEEFRSLFPSFKIIEPLKLNKQIGHRNEEHKIRLFQISGKKNIMVKQIEVSNQNLNEGDVFILDNEKKLYQFIGGKAPKAKVGKAMDITTRLRDERMVRIKAEMETFSRKDPPTPEFWELLGGKPDKIKDPMTEEETLAWEQEIFDKRKIYAVGEYDGSVQPMLLQMEDGLLSNSKLNPEKCYILDFETEVFLWFGKKSNPKIKAVAIDNANELLQDGRPEWVLLSKQRMGAEDILFKSKFKEGWTEYIDTPENFDKRRNIASQGQGIALNVKQKEVNVDKMHYPDKYAIVFEEILITIPSKSELDLGTLQIWYIDKMQKHELPKDEYGIFYSANCYLVLYIIEKENYITQILYFWQGRNCSRDERGSSAMLAKELGQSLGKGCTQIRVPQHKEPAHFLSHFEPFFRVHRGSRTQHKEHIAGTIAYHIRGTEKLNTKAFEVTHITLNPKDCYIVRLAGKKSYIWEGSLASESCKLVAQKLASCYESEFSILKEGSEPEQFWNSLGQGKIVRPIQSQTQDFRPKFFHCNEGKGVFDISLLEEFSQDDLDLKDCFILDLYDLVFIWNGKTATPNKRSMTKQTAIDYITAAQDGRKEATLYIIEAQNEPSEFLSVFHAWDLTNFTTLISLDKLEKIKVQTTGVDPSLKVNISPSTKSEGNLNRKIYSYDRLTERPLPEDVDNEHIERHLSEEDFKKIFGPITLEEFETYPQWKKLNIKKQKRLF